MQVGSYTVHTEKSLGVGGQGTVCEGIHKATGERVAIKIMEINDNTRCAFDSEYKAMNRLPPKTPNVCTTKDIIVKGNQGFLIMKQFNCDLFTYALEMRETPLPEKELNNLFIKICKGVRELHRERVAHLDLKPENILINLETMEPYICDFGASFTSSSPLKNGKQSRSSSQQIYGLGCRGTKQFMSPEMKDTPCAYDPFCSDIYSLGVILHILLTLCYPVISCGAVDVECLRKTVSAGYCDLLSSLLCSASSRISIDKVILHPALTGATSNKGKISNVAKLAKQTAVNSSKLFNKFSSATQQHK
mmetsp:Transcript_10870/g.17130  ORF Transcript_10870/g.17130 Transcript_10870/m.17130 type:complete len:305 (+) Transcript_10870:39-953(+)